MNRARLAAWLFAVFLVGTLAVGVITMPTAADPGDCNDMQSYESQDDYRSCLVNETSKQQVMTYVRSDKADLTAKQIDAVYAVYPDHADAYGFNESEDQEITDWMSVTDGFLASWKAANEDGQSTGSGSGPSQSSDTELVGDAADLGITQPHYVDGSVEKRTDNRTTYLVSSGHLELRPRNFDPDAVTEFGVSSSSASLRYDELTGQYVFDTSETGTYRVTFYVAEQQTVNTANGTTTEMVERRYVAWITVEQAGYVHISEENYDELQTDAANWSEVVATFQPLGPQSMDIEKKLSDAADAYQFISEPWAALKGGFVATIIIMTTEPGGQLVLALLLIIPVAVSAPIFVRYRRQQKLLPEVEAIDQEKMEQFREKRKRILAEDTPHDLPLSPRTADKLREALGENMLQITNRIDELVGSHTVKRVFVQAMGQHNRVAVATGTVDGGEFSGDIRIETRPAFYADGDDDAGPSDSGSDTDTDAGDDGDGPGAPVTDGGVGAIDSGLDEQVFGLRDPSDELVAAIEWDDVDLTLLDEDVPFEDVDVPLSSGGEDKVIEATDVSIPEDFDDREQYAEGLWTVFRYVLSHDFTDGDGAIREERSALSLLHLLASITAEQYDVPTMRAYRDVFIYIANEIDTDHALKKASEDAGFGDTDLDLDIDLGVSGDAD